METRKATKSSSIIQMTHKIIMILLRIIDNISHQIIHIGLLSIFIGIYKNKIIQVFEKNKTHSNV